MMGKDHRSTEKKIFHSLDFVKGIACIFVVFMHCEFPGTFGEIVQVVSRFCVPFFFMVSGFFAFGNPPEKLLKKALRILKITVFACAFYFLFNVIACLFGVPFPKITLKSVVGFLFLNLPIAASAHLWFLLALTYDYFLAFLAEKWKIWKWCYRAIPLLILVYAALAQGCYLAGIDVPNSVYRNFLIEGFLFFALGHVMRLKEQEIRDSKKLSDPVLIAGLLLFTALSVGECYLLGRGFGVNLCTFPQVAAMFLLAIRHPDAFAGHFLTRFGKRFSMMIYILHYFVYILAGYLYQGIGWQDQTLALYFQPILVLFATIALSYPVTAVIARLERRKERTAG